MLPGDAYETTDRADLERGEAVRAQDREDVLLEKGPADAVLLGAQDFLEKVKAERGAA